MTRAIRLADADLAAMGIGGRRVGRQARTAAQRMLAAERKKAFERKLEFDMRCLGFPTPQTQVKFARGREFTSDFAWPEYRLLVEVQGGIWRRGGGAHGGGTAIERDIEKQQLAVIHDWAVFPVTTDQVKNGEALKLIRLALEKKGWKHV